MHKPSSACSIPRLYTPNPAGASCQITKRLTRISMSSSLLSFDARILSHRGVASTSRGSPVTNTTSTKRCPCFRRSGGISCFLQIGRRMFRTRPVTSSVEAVFAVGKHRLAIVARAPGWTIWHIHRGETRLARWISRLNSYLDRIWE